MRFKKFDTVISIRTIGELEMYKKYTVKEAYNYSNSNNEYNISLFDLLWSYNTNNFITLSEYRILKLRKIQNKYESR